MSGASNGVNGATNGATNGANGANGNGAQPHAGELVPRPNCLGSHDISGSSDAKRLKKSIEEKAKSIDRTYSIGYGWSDPLMEGGETVVQLQLGNRDKYRGKAEGIINTVSIIDALEDLKSHLESGLPAS